MLLVVAIVIGLQTVGVVLMSAMIVAPAAAARQWTARLGALVLLAGAFGAHISPLHAMVLGMIPDVPLDKVTSAGNAAGTGARIALCNVASRREIERVVRQITKIETAIEPKFQDHFVAANAIPHKTDPFPELGRIVPLPSPSFNTGGDTGEGGRRRRRRA